MKLNLFEVVYDVSEIICASATFQDRRRRRNQAGNIEAESQREISDTDKSDTPDSRQNGRRN